MKNWKAPKYLFFLLWLLPHSAHGALPDYCFAPNVHEIKSSLYDQGSRTFSYRYQIISQSDKSVPTVIYLQGGPGSPAIQDWSSAASKELLNTMVGGSKFNWIFIDPRGIGCNSAKEHSIRADALTTELTAKDVVNVILAEGLQKFILYGHSYGSELATVIANLSERSGLKPASVVLGGVVGFGTAGEDGSDAINRNNGWSAAQTFMPSDALKFLNGPQASEIDAYIWDDFMYDLLLRGRFIKDAKIVWPLEDAMKLIADPKNDISKIKEAASVFPKSGWNGIADEDDVTLVYQSIACHEIQNYAHSILFQANHFADVIHSQNFCENIQLDRRYDSKNWPIRAPIIYLSGSADPCTPPSQVAYHLKNQRLAKRTFISILNGGHSGVGRALNDCQTEFWNSAASGGVGMKESLAKCAINPSVQFMPAD